MGLMLGIELVRDRKSKEAADMELPQIVKDCKTRGLLIGKGGFYGNVLRIKPPMCRTKADMMQSLLNDSVESYNAG